MERNKRVSFRVNDREFNEINNRIKQSSYTSRNEYLRDVLLEDKTVALDDSKIELINKDINEHGEYINMVAKNINSRKYIKQSDINAVYDLIKRINDNIEKVYELVKIMEG